MVLGLITAAAGTGSGFFLVNFLFFELTISLFVSF
jgi:hypothetical protein